MGGHTDWGAWAASLFVPGSNCALLWGDVLAVAVGVLSWIRELGLESRRLPVPTLNTGSGVYVGSFTSQSVIPRELSESGLGCR